MFTGTEWYLLANGDGNACLGLEVAGAEGERYRIADWGSKRDPNVELIDARKNAAGEQKFGFPVAKQHPGPRRQSAGRIGFP